MQTDNRLFDDLAKVATSAIGSLQSARDEATSRIRQQFERIVDSMDLVSREEFDVVKAMAQKSRLENDKLAKRVAELEAKLGITPKPAQKSSTRAKSGAAKSAATNKSAATKKTGRKGTTSKAAAGGAKSRTSGRRTRASQPRRTTR